MSRRTSLLFAVALAAAAAAPVAAQAAQTVNGVATSNIGVLNTTPGVFTNVADSFGAVSSFTDDFTFTVAGTTSGGASATGLDIVFDPTSSTGFSFTNLSSITVGIYQGTPGSGTLVTSWSGTPSANLAFDNLTLSNNPYYLEISGVTQSATLAASYVGVISAVAVPEPGTWALLAAGLLGLAGVARRRAA